MTPITTRSTYPSLSTHDHPVTMSPQKKSSAKECVLFGLPWAATS